MVKEDIKKRIFDILLVGLKQDGKEWLINQTKLPPKSILTAFVAAPRFVGKTLVHWEGIWPVEGIYNQTESIPADLLTRLYLLLSMPDDRPEDYVLYIETLFDTAEVNELVALIRSLPLLEFPDKWLWRATEAVRSNMEVVFDAIALDNPYPYYYFDESSWNQMTLKAVFLNKPIERIFGLHKRINLHLSEMIYDLYLERQAAGRMLLPKAWDLVIHVKRPI